ncbi:Heme-degrading monooxygenase [compost metagenome]
MLVVTNTIKVKEGAGAALAGRFTGNGGVQTMPGFVRLEVWHGAPKDGAEELKICTVWENEEAFKGWTSSEAFRQSHRGAGKNDDILGASLDKYELLARISPGE